MTFTRHDKIFIFNGYPKLSRDNFDASDVGHPHDFFIDFLSRYAPDVETEIRFIADLDHPLPSDRELSACKGCIWTGSDLTIYQVDPGVDRQIELARNLFRLGVSSMGSCWGIQMAAVAAGGVVAKNPRGREWGIAKAITISDAGKKSCLLQGKPEKFDGFIMHLDEVVKLPENTKILAGNEHTAIQAIEVFSGKGSFFGTQYHPEYNLLEMGRLIAARAQPLVNEGFFSSVEDVADYAKRMKTLYHDPDNARLREQLDVGDDILKETIKEQELRNWMEYIII